MATDRFGPFIMDGPFIMEEEEKTMPLKALAPFFVGLLLAGCTGGSTTPDPAPAPPPPGVAAGDACDAEALQDRVGQRFTATLGQTLQAKSGATTLRVLRPGTAATLDYRQDRLNVRLDERDLIAAIDCG
ncbi:I78 family peptidase inhibitor [Halomonas saccharevitans]|uniref:Peptidase inhibitor I78 family protein n=1 Tax=Halomonas saccharevitans TaxID=416872 RepID=A0A1I7BKZ5_9GAMM|nr:I78 family peptidase inhibitor [Halomonas saccharevitans]SFT87836.1 Peptidase inhibitor I78 family protein [Halomonas saccharevitans]